MDDGEYDLEEQLEAAAGFISDEETADAILGREAEEIASAKDGLHDNMQLNRREEWADGHT